MTGLNDELQRRLQAFRSELRAEQLFDSEFSANPHHPGDLLNRLVELGPVVVPTLVELSRSSDRDERFWAVLGFQQLGGACGAEGLAALEALTRDPSSSDVAIDVLEQLAPERFWALQLYTVHNALQSIVRRRQVAGTAHLVIERLRVEGLEKPLHAAVEALRDVDEADTALVEELQRVMGSSVRQARARALFALARLPRASDVEAMIEAAVLSDTVPEALIDRAAPHPESLRLVDVLVRNGWTAYLARLVQRRLQAGRTTPRELVAPFIAQRLRHPHREWRYEEHEVHDAAEAALFLGDPALIPALVDAVIPANGGYAWEPLVAALTSFGAPALAAVEARYAEATDADVRERLRFMVARLRSPTLPRIEHADAQFIAGSIDHTTGGAFRGYADVLRSRPSAHAAFQLAWIDRAFGVLIDGDRVRFIRELGFNDEALLAELASPVTPLEGGRFKWRRCDAANAVRVAAAGLPGLAFLGSRDLKHAQAAEAHVNRVRAACGAAG